MKAALGTHIRIARDDLTSEEVMQVVADLTFRNLAKENASAFARPGVQVDPEEMLTRGYLSDDDYLWVPRAYNLPASISERIEIVDERPGVELLHDFPVSFIELLPHQIEPATALVNAEGDMLLQLGCGKGKTQIALWYAAQMCRKTLIVVDRFDLADQWVDRIVGDKDRLPCFPTMSRKHVGMVGGGKHTIGKHFTVATIQTLAKIQDPEWFDQWGLVIFDEAHVMGGDGSFGAVPSRFPCTRLALTATPERKDGLTSLLFMTFGGPPVFRDTVRDTPATWVFCALPPLVDDARMETLYRWTRATPFKEALKVLKAPEYVTAATQNEDWNARIIEDLHKAVSAGRSVLVLGERVEHMNLLGSMAQALGIDAAVITRHVPRKERKERKKCQVIFSTWQLAGKGLDVPQLDTLFLLNTYDDGGRLMQEKGRVDARGVEGKKKPLVIIYCHDGLTGTFRKRRVMERYIREGDVGATIMQTRARFLCNGSRALWRCTNTRTGRESSASRRASLTSWRGRSSTSSGPPRSAVSCTWATPRGSTNGVGGTASPSPATASRASSPPAVASAVETRPRAGTAAARFRRRTASTWPPSAAWASKVSRRSSRATGRCSMPSTRRTSIMRE